jgi:hypothetical protein
MAVRFSKKIFNDQLTALKTALANGVIHLYSGSQPASPEAAPTGTLIGSIQLSGGTWAAGTATYGLEFGTAAGGSISKAAAENWLFTCVTGGTVGWGRFIANTTAGSGSLSSADTGALDGSEVFPRIDFSVGITSGDMTMGKVTYAANETGAVSSFTIPLSNIS